MKGLGSIFYSIALMVFLSQESLGQIKYYHADSSGVHLRYNVLNEKGECMDYLDTAVVEMHTWFYYKSHDIVSDSVYFVKGKKVREQKVYDADFGRLGARLVYHSDTVFVTSYFPGGEYRYQAIKLSEFGFKPLRYTNMIEFGYSTTRSETGIVWDSVLWKNGEIIEVKLFYNNGRVRRHDFIENGKVRIQRFRENGKWLKKKKGEAIFPNVFIQDSVDLEYYSENIRYNTCIPQYDTSIVKPFTWSYRHWYHSISDSTYELNGQKFKVQKLFWQAPDGKFADEIFTYSGDTVFYESFRIGGTWKSQFIKTVGHEDDKDLYSSYGFETDYKEFGWSIFEHKDGYISDSTFYEAGKREEKKEFYSTGEIKQHTYKTDSVYWTFEFKKNGKIKNQWRGWKKPSFWTFLLPFGYY